MTVWGAVAKGLILEYTANLVDLTIQEHSVFLFSPLGVKTPNCYSAEFRVESKATGILS